MKNVYYVKVGILALLILLSIFNYLYLPEYNQPSPLQSSGQPAEHIIDAKSLNLPENQTKELESTSVVVDILSNLEG